MTPKGMPWFSPRRAGQLSQSLEAYHSIRRLHRQLAHSPRHLLEDKYRANKVAFIDGDEWSLINAPGVSVPEAIVARDQWVSKGEGYLKTWVIRLHYAEFQHAELPNRQRAVTELSVRQGMLHALDRQGMADATYLGLSGVADGYVLPNDPIFPEVDRVLTKYPHDPGRAAMSLAEAVWRRVGAESLLRNASGQTLDFVLVVVRDECTSERKEVADALMRTPFRLLAASDPRTRCWPCCEKVRRPRGSQAERFRQVLQDRNFAPFALWTWILAFKLAICSTWSCVWTWWL